MDGRKHSVRRDGRELDKATRMHLRDYQLDCERRALRATSIVAMRCKLLCMAEAVAPTPLLEAGAGQLQEALDGRRLGARARYGYLSILHGFYAWALLEGRATVDPTVRIRRPRAPRSVPRPISDADLRAAMLEAPPRIKAMMVLAAYQGLRCREIATLQREDIIDTNNPPVMIVRDGKGGHQRVLPLHPDVMEALRCANMPRRGYVFVRTDTQEPLQPHNVSHYLALYLRSVGVDATAHQLRHWFGSKLYAECQDLRVAQEMLGHMDPRTTTVYVAFSMENARRAVEGLNFRN